MTNFSAVYQWNEILDFEKILKKNHNSSHIQESGSPFLLKADVEQLLVSLILDNQVQGHIEQVHKLLECRNRSQIEDPRNTIIIGRYQHCPTLSLLAFSIGMLLLNIILKTA
ncbi:PCI/PINT associated module [Artemisia annua]|uniref:PCI/PINT associated module n=1 Tax=Artemisia annua TaxID=35608 RepID=A0A2U1MAH5_ARTAN|nr:PCI/PINT associated module [Artemisia annua]